MKKKIAQILQWSGILIMVLVIAGCIPFTLPKLLGYQLYEVKSGSMEPEYPVGSLAGVKPEDASDMKVGDVITYTLGTDTELVMTHRILEVDAEQKVFITKGDANETVDEAPVDFVRVIGKPVFCIPKIAALSNFIHSTGGKLAAVSIFVLVALMWITADILKKQDGRTVQEPELQPKKKKRVSDYLLFGAGALLVVAALVQLVPILDGYKKGTDTWNEIEDNYLLVAQDKSLGRDEEVTEKETEGWWYEDVVPSFDELIEINEDVAAWIRFDNIEVLSYPVIYSGENQVYLKKDIYGNDSVSGSIFIEAACNPDFNDCHTILYGHNMKNLSMFGSLKKYKNDGFYEENRYFTIYTKKAAYRYEIFAYSDVAENDAVYTVGFAPNEQFEEFIGEMYRNSYKDTGVTAEKEDKIVTLSTCSATGMRFVVHAVRIDEHVY